MAVTLGTLAFLTLRGQGLRRAVLGTAGFAAVAALVLGAKALGVVEPAVPWIVGGFGVIVVFGLARHFRRPTVGELASGSGGWHADRDRRWPATRPSAQRRCVDHSLLRYVRNR